MTLDNKLCLYHASTEVVEQPQWNYKKPGRFKENRDLGEGFYLSPNSDYPVYLYCANDTIYLNKYTLDLDGLKVLHLSDDMQWLLIVSFHRSSFSRRKKYHGVRDKIRKFVSNFDLVIGTISDDDFFSTLDNFIRNLITDSTAISIAQMMDFGVQYVLKSDKACQQIKFLEPAIEIGKKKIDYHRVTKQYNRENMASMVDDRRVQLHRQGNDGRYFAEIIEEAEEIVSAWLR